MKGKLILAASLLGGLIWPGSAMAQSPQECPQSALEKIGQDAYTALRYETAENVIIICEVQSGRLYLHSFLKGDDSAQAITLPASPTNRKYEYKAESGRARYVINPDRGFTKIEDGRILLREGLYSWTAWPMPENWRGARSTESFRGRNFSPGTAAQVTPRQVNVRSRPTARSGVITKLRQGTTVDVLGRENNSTDGFIWYRILVPRNGRSGWIRGDLLRPS